MVIINPAYVDVDLRAEAEKLGIPAGNLGMSKPRAMRSYADVEELIPEAKWPELAAAKKAKGGGTSKLITWILNQQNEGSCVGNSETQAHQIMQARTFGKSRVTKLSACSAYQLIGSGPNSGADVGDALDRGCDTGIIPLDTPENRALFGNIVMPPTGFYTKRPAGWEPIAAQFRFDEHLVIQNRNALISALLRDRPVCVGRAGHSIVYVEVIFDGSTMYVLYVNSWGQWGIAAGDFSYGFGLDSMRLIDQSADWCYTPGSIIVPDHIATAA